MSGSFAKRYALPLLVATATLAAVLTPVILSEREDARRRTDCHALLDPAAEDLLSDPVRAESVGAEALLEAGATVGAQAGLEVDLPSEDPPVHVAVAATSEDLRHVCMDTTIAFVPSMRIDRLHLLVPTFPGAVSFPEIRLDGVRLVDAPVDPRSELHRVPLDGPIPAGRPTIVRVRAEVELPRDWQEVSTLDGHLPSVDLGPRMPLRDRHHRAVRGVWSVTMHSSVAFASGGVDAPCGDGCVRVLATDVPLPVLTHVPGGRRAIGPEGAVEVRAAPDVPDYVATATSAATARFGSILGPLPWTELDLVASIDEPPGFPTPGLAAIHGDVATDATPCGPDVDERCAAVWIGGHLAAHQWLGGVVVAPYTEHRVVVESIAGYLAYVRVAEALGEEVGAGVREGIAAWYLDARAAIAGLPPHRAPREPLAPRQELALVHGRGTLAWLAAERALGRDAVLDFVAEVLSAHRGGNVSPGDVRHLAEAHDPALRDALERHWFSGERLNADRS